MTLFKSLYDTLEREEGDTYMWMLPYSTLMLVLMIMFSALYVYSYQDTIRYELALTSMEESTEDISPSLKEIVLAQKIDEFIHELKMEGIAEIKTTPHAIKLSLASPAIFDSASAEVRPELMPLMLKLYEHLRLMENMIIVEGHTDNVPIHTSKYSSNWELSAARAFSMIYFYIQRGIDPRRLVAHGYGEHRPTHSNTSQVGRAMNRRIEITILREGFAK
ncbi:MAG: OmpA family protein [Thermodesulfovibrionales bacterium]|nr:OmpA family protein [Thermodesulfovibrionales bacterium]